MTRLIIHAGLGKTGTSAFQEAMKSIQDHLIQAGVVFLGPQASTLTINDDQFTFEANRGHPDGIKKTLDMLEQMAAGNSNIKRVVWSDEKIGMSRSLPAIVKVLGDFINNSAVFEDFEVILCFRRQDEWAESAYRQWGTKHKTSAGTGVERPMEWLERNQHFLNYLGQYKTWSQLGQSHVRVISYDDIQASGGTVRHLFRALNIPCQPDSLDAFDRSHTSMDVASSYMNALFNASEEGSVKPSAFRELMDFYQLPQLDRMNRSFFSKERCREILSEHEDDNRELARIALGRDELFPSERSVIHRSYTNGTEDALIYLTRIAARQHRHIVFQEDQLNELKGKVDALERRSILTWLSKSTLRKSR